MIKPEGSWVAIPTPFNDDGSIDFGGFETLIDFHVNHGTSMLLVMGSAGEATLLSYEERKSVVSKVSAYAKGKIPVFYGAAMPTTQQTVEFSRYAEAEGADGLVFVAPPYLLPPQTAVLDHLRTCMQSVSIPVTIYNNPARVVVNIDPDTIVTLATDCDNFVADKEAMADVRQLVEVKRRLGDRLSVLVCDFPKYSILLPVLAIGGSGAANIGGNLIPDEMAEMARPWTSFEQVTRSRELWFEYSPLIEAFYWFSNPIVIKAALNHLGLPGGVPRKPNPTLEGARLEKLKELMDSYGVTKKYHV